MKNIKITILMLLLAACSGSKYKLIEQEIIEGKISATKEGYNGTRVSTFPRIWVQNATQTREISIPFEYENRWKVGDSCILIIEKYRENE